MRRWMVGCAGLGLLAAGGAAAGLNPASPGLPVTQNVYGNGVNYANNRLSSMCVDCHTLSPKRNLDADNPWPTMGGSHFVTWYGGGSFRATNNAKDNADFNNDPTAYYRVKTGWPDAGRVTPGYSKYGDFAAGLSRMYSNANNRAATQSTVTANYQAYGVLCESCHNLIANAAGGNNLLAPHRDSVGPNNWDDPSKLCEGCHKEQAKGSPAHHALSGGVTHDVPSGWPFVGDQVGRHGTYPAAHSLSVTHTDHVDNPPVNKAGAALGATYTSRAGVSCTSCHGVHGALVQTGARMLKRGRSSVAGMNEQQVNVAYYAGQPAGYAAGAVVGLFPGGVPMGLQRQSDLDPTGVNRVVYNRDPLCDACHTY